MKNEQLSLFEEKKELVLETHMPIDDIVIRVSEAFDYEYDGTTKEIIQVPTFPTDFQIGLIVGSSGSGKSVLLRECFGERQLPEWDNTKSIVSHFESYDDAVSRFGAAGLNSIPTWMKPYCVLSTGEKFRADIARSISSNATIDEFTSTVNRQVAVSCSASISKYIRSSGLHRVVFASCHDDIIPYLEPDWCYNTDTHAFYNGRYLQRPSIKIQIQRCDIAAWDIFYKYHYLSERLNTASACYIATIGHNPVAFVAVLSLPSGTLKNAYREHRLVVLPDYQGMGIGNRVSEAIAQAYVDVGCRYYSKTANPRCGEHRDKSELWRGTSHNHSNRKDYKRLVGEHVDFAHNYRMSDKLLLIHANRRCYSHEYVGLKSV